MRACLPLLLLVLVLQASAAPARADCGATCALGNCTFDGITNFPAGSATLSIDACNLLVSGVGSSGLDGVVQAGLSSVYMVTTLATPNFSGSVLGTQADIVQVGVVAGQSGREISTTRIANVTGTTLRLEMSCAAIGVTGYAIEIYAAGTLVHSQPLGQDIPILRFPKGDMEAMACALLPGGELYTTIRFGGQVPLTIQTVGGDLGPYEGDCVKLRGFDPADVPTLQEAIDNRFRNTGAVAITSLFAGGLPTVDHVCPAAPVPVRTSSWGTLKVIYR
jgi:hypothetical protein